MQTWAQEVNALLYYPAVKAQIKVIHLHNTVPQRHSVQESIVVPDGTKCFVLMYYRHNERYILLSMWLHVVEISDGTT